MNSRGPQIRPLDNVFGGAPGIRPADLHGDSYERFDARVARIRWTIRVGSSLLASGAITSMGFWLLT